MGGAGPQFGTGDVGFADRHETGLDRLAPAFTLADRRLKPLIDFARQQILERAAIPFCKGQHDHLVGSARSGDEMRGLEARVIASNGIEPTGDRRALLGDALPAFARVGNLEWFLRALGGATRQCHHIVVGGATTRVASGIRVIRRPLAAGALPEHASQTQEDEYRQRQEDDGVYIRKHVWHALDSGDIGNRRIGRRPAKGNRPRRASVPSSM